MLYLHIPSVHHRSISCSLCFHFFFSPQTSGNWSWCAPLHVTVMCVWVKGLYVLSHIKWAHRSTFSSLRRLKMCVLFTSTLLIFRLWFLCYRCAGKATCIWCFDCCVTAFQHSFRLELHMNNGEKTVLVFMNGSGFTDKARGNEPNRPISVCVECKQRSWQRWGVLTSSPNQIWYF